MPVDNVFWVGEFWGGGELMAMHHDTQKKDRHSSLPWSGVLGSAQSASHRGSAGRGGSLLSRRRGVPEKGLSGGGHTCH